MENDAMASLLQQLRIELRREIGEQIEVMYLYGSQARKEARPDSDVDVMIVLRNDFLYYDMVERTGEIVARLSLQYDTVISLAFSNAKNFYHQKIPFYLNIKREGTVILIKMKHYRLDLTHGYPYCDPL